MIQALPIQTSERWLSISVFVCLSVLLSTPARSQTVYRCPGPPVIYTDEISSDDAKARNCLSMASGDRQAEVGRNRPGAQSYSGLPLDLRYGMSRAETQAHMKLMRQYEVPPPNAGELAYVVPDPGSSSKNGLFLKFDGEKLVEIASMKTGMTQPMYDKYMESLRTKTKEWIGQGMTAVLEDRRNAFYLYKDERSYVSVSGTSSADKSPMKSVTLTFSEGKYFKKVSPSNK